MTPPGPIDQALLLEEVSWIRRLARELVADRELAEDLVQETCVVALEHGPREAGKLRQWLAEVLRNLLRQHARGAGRRRVREAATARPEALEPTDALVERVLVQRELVNAVLALEEPYRSTVLLRFFEELPPREIARRTGAPVATVQSRLTRALAKLRERLDGERPAWALVLLPWARPGGALAPPTALTMLMNTKLFLAAGAAVLAAGAFVLWGSGPEQGRTRGEELAPGAAASAPLSAARGPATEVPPSAAAREALPVPTGVLAPKTSLPAAAASAPWVVRLRVLDADGLPMSGVGVRAEESAEVLATSGSGGWCVFETRADELVLEAADPRWVTIHQGNPARVSALDPVLVLAPALELGGHVRDEAGRALGGASVSFELPRGFHTRFSEVLEATRSLRWRVPSDADGRFAFARVPAVPGATLGATLAGYACERSEAPLVPLRDLELLLFRPRTELAGVLRGRVLDPLGQAVEGARVGLGLASVVSDERGQFEIPLRRAVTAELLTATKAGFLPARLERPGEPDATSSGWPTHVELVLPGAALSIRGRVLDHESKPVAQARVWLHDPTPGAPVGQVPTFLEPLMAGATLPPQALESEANLPEEDGDNFYDYVTRPRAPSALWHWCLTDSAGRFELGGLDRRRYRLDVLRPESLEVTTSASLAAGDQAALIQLDAPDVFARVAGRVLDERGQGLADVQVDLYRPMVDARARIFGGHAQVVMVENAGRTTTDAEGRFALSDVPRRGAHVTVRGDAIVPTSAEITAETLELEVAVRCHLEVVLRAEPERGDEFELVDGEGRTLDILVLSAGSNQAMTSMPLIDGRSGVVSVSSHARTLRLLKQGVLVEQRALALLPGDVNRIEL